jgi:hypothetical protein
MKFKGLAVGYQVWVVQQRTRYERDHLTDRPSRAQYMEVTKIGSKYAYLGEGRGVWVQRFNLSDGRSDHGADNNARSNGQGFDVYWSKVGWEQAQRNEGEAKRLTERLLTRGAWRLPDLPPWAVREIHAVLDRVNEETD